MIINAREFKFRSDLENEIRNRFGLTPDAKDHIIQGTREQLQRLQLSDTTTFWGIKCEITDTPTEKKSGNKPDRGQLKDFKLK